MSLLKMFVVIALCMSLSLVAFAHPGRTDSNGGHTDHSTGEYHYHHGYSAHRHTDADGDGILDCPYRITSSIEKPKTENSYSDYQKKSATPTKVQKKQASFEAVMLLIFGVVFAVGFVLDLISGAIKQKKSK